MSQYQTRTRAVKTGIDKPEEKTEKDEIKDVMEKELNYKREIALAKAEMKNKKKVHPDDEDQEEDPEQDYDDEQDVDPKDDKDKKEGGEYDDTYKHKIPFQDPMATNRTEKELEKEIEQKGLMHVVEELCARQKYNMKLKTPYKRYITCFDNEEDELTKKYRYMGERKLQNEMDISRILKKIRNYEAVNSYLLNERQRYLLKFNSRHVIDSDSDLISLESANSVFSVPSNDEDRLRSIRQRIMSKLVQDDDLRDENCAFRLVNRDLENGVGRADHGD